MFFLDQTQTYHPNPPLGKVEPNLLPLRQIEQVQQFEIPPQNLNPKVDNELMNVQDLIDKKRKYLFSISIILTRRSLIRCVKQ